MRIPRLDLVKVAEILANLPESPCAEDGPAADVQNDNVEEFKLEDALTIQEQFSELYKSNADLQAMISVDEARNLSLTQKHQILA